jgi:hypothetical protein
MDVQLAISVAARIEPLLADLADVKAQRDRLADTLRNIKMSVCGEAAPNWAASWETAVSRGGIADWCDEALAAIGEKT